MSSVRIPSKSVPIQPSLDLVARRHEIWLLELTSIPTAAGHEERVMAWIDGWLAPRRSRLDIRRDDAGNYLIQRKDRSRKLPPILVTAHLDHPAFVVVVPPASKGSANARREVTLDFRGGVHDPYFVGARIEVIDYSGRRSRARILSLELPPTAKRASTRGHFKRVVARLDDSSQVQSIATGDIGRWILPAPRIANRTIAQGTTDRPSQEVRVIETHACDDLAAVAAACAAFDRLLAKKSAANVGLLLTVAEEVGFIGAIHAARSKFIPSKSRLICLENSRSFPHDSPIGAGAILRVGDRMSVFSPSLTNELSALFAAHAKRSTGKTPFRWQRKLMAGGACEATAFAAYGFESTCLCLPLGNYHNMSDIDGVLAGRCPAKIDCEFVALSDYHGLIEMIEVAVTGIAKSSGDGSSSRAPIKTVMEALYKRSVAVLGG